MANMSFVSNMFTNRSFAETASTNKPVDRASLTIWFTVMIAICIFGILANAIFITVIVRSRRLRSGTGILILNLVATCFISCTITYPLHIILVYGHNYWFTSPRNICTYVHYFVVVTTYANNWSEACLAINRFIATVLPHHYKAWATWPVCLIMVTFTWVSGAASLIPFTTGQVGYFSVTPQGQCGVAASNSLGTWLLSINSYAPYIVVGLAVAAVLAKVGTRKSRIQPRITDPSVTARTLRQRLWFKNQLNMAAMLFLVFMFNLIATLPMSLLNNFYVVVYSQLPILRIWMRIFVLTQYACTPVIFFMCNRDYRVGLWKLLRIRTRMTGQIDGGATNTNDPNIVIMKDAYPSNSLTRNNTLNSRHPPPSRATTRY